MVHSRNDEGGCMTQKNNINQKPASIFPESDGTVLVRYTVNISPF